MNNPFIFGSKLLLLCLTTVLTTNCTAETSRPKDDSVEYAEQSIRKAVGDSICNILMESKVTVMLIQNDKGETVYSEEKKLSKDELAVLKFLLKDPDMTSRDDVVYGIMRPCIKFKFSKSKKEFVCLSLDFGLHKWSILDAEGKELLRYNIGNKEMLRFCHYLYPDNKFISEHFKTAEQ